MEIWSALMVGLLGSLHCVGMCGPIMLALPLTTQERRQIFLQSLLYHLGRIITYSLLGGFMGLMGWGIALTGYQKSFSILLGLLLIAMAFFSISVEQKILKIPAMQKGFFWIKEQLGKLILVKNKYSAFRVGMLNGLLPCGLVYIALAGAVANDGPFGGAIYMLAFGLGTLPLMLGVMYFGKLKSHLLFKFRKWIPLGLFLFGLLLLYRGMMLDIPANLSFWEANNFPVMCH